MTLTLNQTVQYQTIIVVAIKSNVSDMFYCGMKYTYVFLMNSYCIVNTGQ